MSLNLLSPNTGAITVAPVKALAHPVTVLRCGQKFQSHWKGRTLFLLLFSTQFHSEMNHSACLPLIVPIPHFLGSLKRTQGQSNSFSIYAAHFSSLVDSRTDRLWVFTFLGPEKPPGLLCPDNCTKQVPRPVWCRETGIYFLTSRRAGQATVGKPLPQVS